MRNIAFLNYSFLFCLFLSINSCAPESGSKKQPNFLFIITDDQGWGDLAANGNPYVKTPNIDALAETGVQFKRFYVSPVCSPTRAEILTGRYHPRGGIYDTSSGGERLDLDETTFAEILQQNGYQTAAFGKWHNGTQPPFHPNNRGFEEFYGFCSGHWGNYIHPMLEHNGEVVFGEGYIIDDLTNKAISQIEKSGDEPFFMYLAYNTPHSPMQITDEWWKKYKDLELDTTHRFADRENLNKTRAAYAMCENIDWNVGRMIEALANKGVLENTIIIYMSDNGPNGWRWNEGLKGIKGHTDEGGVRSPFIVNWKEHFNVSEIEQNASTIDVLPTLLDLADIDIPDHLAIDGKSLTPLLYGESEEWEERMVFSHWNGRVSVRNQKYMLDHEEQLFDLENDPGQLDPLDDGFDDQKLLLSQAKENWKNDVLSELDSERREIFPIGFEKSEYFHLPARDAEASGEIERSNRFPNSSFFRNWNRTTDSIFWDCEVVKGGLFKAIVYYTIPEENVGAELRLSQGSNSISKVVEEAHDPSFIGVELDRIQRQESYEKEFKPLEMGVLELKEGQQDIVLKSAKIVGGRSIDFRLLVLERVE